MKGSESTIIVYIKIITTNAQLLNGEPVDLFLRKKEISESQISQYIQLYEKYVKSNKIKFIKIDTTTNDKKETFDIASKSIEILINEK